MNLINQKQDLMPHPLIGIGHSMGGTQLYANPLPEYNLVTNSMTSTQLALWHPRLLRSLVLLDPVIQIPSASIAPAALSIARREVWPSREVAAESFKSKAFYQAWDPRTLDLWVKHGLREIPTELFPAESKANGATDERVTLTTSKHQELFTFLRPTYNGGPSDMYADLDPVLQNEYPNYPYYRPEPALVFRRLPELRPSVLYVFGGKSTLSPAEECEAKLARTGTGIGGSGGAIAGRVKNTILDCGHLVGLERVNECADAVAEFLGQELQRWRSDMHAFQQNWKLKPRREQITMDERWTEDIRHLAQPGKL